MIQVTPRCTGERQPGIVDDHPDAPVASTIPTATAPHCMRQWSSFAPVTSDAPDQQLADQDQTFSLWNMQDLRASLQAVSNAHRRFSRTYCLQKTLGAENYGAQQFFHLVLLQTDPSPVVIATQATRQDLCGCCRSLSRMRSSQLKLVT